MDKRKRCEHPDCTRQPAFNVAGARVGRFCGAHKEAGMVDVTSKRCEHPDCASRPAFDVAGARVGRASRRGAVQRL